MLVNESDKEVCLFCYRFFYSQYLFLTKTSESFVQSRIRTKQARINRMSNLLFSTNAIFINLTRSWSGWSVITFIYLSIHLGTTAVIPENLVPAACHVLRERVLDSLDHPRLVQLKHRRVLLVISILLRDRLMPLGEPVARSHERANGALAAVSWRLVLGAVQDGDVEAVGSRALESTAPLLRRFAGPSRFLLVLRARRVRRATRVYLRRGRC